MHSAVLFLSLLFFAIPVLDSKYPPDEDDISKTFCTHDSEKQGIETFASSFYTAMVVKHGFDVVAGIEVSGTDAANTNYDAILKVLEAEGLCDAAWVAITASRPFVSLQIVPLASYLEKTAHTVGSFLLEKGLLDCSTAIPLSFDLFRLVCSAFDGLEENKLGSYQYAVVKGLLDFIHEHGLDVDSSANDLAYKFFKEFKSGNNCTKSAD